MGQTVARGAHEDAPLGGAVIRRHLGGPGKPRGRRRGELHWQELCHGDHDGENGALEQAEPQGAAHGEDDGVEAFSVSASASYSC